MEAQQQYDIITLTNQDEDFPLSLIEIGSDCPAMIHCMGNLSLLGSNTNRIAIIGARMASSIGLQRAYELGKELAKKGNIIVSGLALGCDKAAHEGCLDAGGKTIAVVASGLDIIHPKKKCISATTHPGSLWPCAFRTPFGSKSESVKTYCKDKITGGVVRIGHSG